MRVLYIHVIPNCSEKQLSKQCDRHISGIYAVEVDESLNAVKAASSALDTFHSKIAIGVLDDFEILVYEGTKQINEDPDHEGYTLSGTGNVWFLGPLELKERLFSGIYPCGIVYADRLNEKCGDYKRLAFLPYDTLDLDIEGDCPVEMKRIIMSDAERIQAQKGQKFRISFSGQTVTLGSALRKDN